MMKPTPAHSRCELLLPDKITLWPVLVVNTSDLSFRTSCMHIMSIENCLMYCIICSTFTSVRPSTFQVPTTILPMYEYNCKSILLQPSPQQLFPRHRRGGETLLPTCCCSPYSESDLPFPLEPPSSFAVVNLPCVSLLMVVSSADDCKASHASHSPSDH